MQSNRLRNNPSLSKGVESPGPVNRYRVGAPRKSPSADVLTIIPVRQTRDRNELKRDFEPAVFDTIRAEMNDNHFSAAEGEMRHVRTAGGRIGLVGMGKDHTDRSMYRWIGACAVQMGRETKVESVVIVRGSIAEERWPQAAADIAEGSELGSFTFSHYKHNSQKDRKARPLHLHFATDSAATLFNTDLEQAVTTAAATNFARQLANHPPNVIHPGSLVQICRSVAHQLHLKFRVITFAEADRLSMGGLCSVGRGSPRRPAIIILEHAPAVSRVKPPIAVVGKAVTFDTGGISIKPAADMGAMKYDKCGGMAAIGVAVAAAMLNLPQRVVCAIPTAENMPDGDAYRPGDIIQMHNGKTVDVTNTDAEGRLILADAISYICEEYKPKYLIDLATLTGGIVTALGGVYAGLMSNHDDLAAELVAAGERTDEWLWRLPLQRRYRKLLDSPHADMVNSGGREAQAIQGGMFLQEFVPDSVPWAHLDIAGVAHPRKEYRYLKGDQSSGFGVRLIVELIKSGANHQRK
ncbi:MAG: leucyl aminopeptidase family protein [Phycisphaerae bacterium]